MNAVHAITVFPIILAEVTSLPEHSWALTLANYGVATTMLGWFMWRDKLDRDERKAERADTERRHLENLAAMRKTEDAFRTHTDLLIVGLAAMKTIDIGYSSLLDKIKASNIHDSKT